MNPSCEWSAKVDARIRILLRIIEEHGGMLPMSANQIGNMLGLGEARVLRLFSAEVGKPLRRHLLEVRMARAAASLKDGVMPIKTIAFNCGYSEVSNFYRDFKVVHGTSPMQMRLRHLTAQIDQENVSYRKGSAPNHPRTFPHHVLL
jgi:AraC-like DNA-binding protein